MTGKGSFQSAHDPGEQLADLGLADAGQVIRQQKAALRRLKALTLRPVHYSTGSDARDNPPRQMPCSKRLTWRHSGLSAMFPSFAHENASPASSTGSDKKFADVRNPM